MRPLSFSSFPRAAISLFANTSSIGRVLLLFLPSFLRSTPRWLQASNNGRLVNITRAAAGELGAAHDEFPSVEIGHPSLRLYLVCCGRRINSRLGANLDG